MAVKNYQKCIPVKAIQFEGTESAHITDIINFVGMPISVDYTGDGARLRVIRGAFDVVVAYVHDYIIKEANGNLKRMGKADFEVEYTEIP